MYGAAATELIRCLKRDHGEIIPEYRYELVEQVVNECDELYAGNLRTSQTATTRDTNGQEPEGESSGNNSQTIETIENEIERDEPELGDNIAIGEKDLMVMQVRHTAKLWNKRCMIAYHYERLNILKRLRWEYGNNLPREIVKNLSKEELEWFTKYSDNLFSYMKSLNDGRGLDLTLYMRPPRKLYIQVRCLRDYGQFDLEDGQPVMLKKDSIHYLPLSQCEKLIHQGVLEQTSL